MADLTRFSKTFKYQPRWLGNREQEGSFSVRIKRLTKGAYERFLAEHQVLLEGPQPTAEELVAHFAPVLTGPHGVVSVEGAILAEGDLLGLMGEAARESLEFEEALAREIGQAVALFHRIEENALGNCERRRGGLSGTPTGTTPAAATSLPPAAPTAEPPSSGDGTSSTSRPGRSGSAPRPARSTR